MKALVGAFNQEKALVGAFSVIVQPVVEPMENYTALPQIVLLPDEALLAPPEAAVTLGGGPVPEQLRPEERGVARDVAVGDTAVLQQRQGQCYVICICQTSGFLSFKA